MRAEHERFGTIRVSRICDMVDNTVATLERELEVEITHTHLQQLLPTTPQPAARRFVHVHEPAGVRICNEDRFTRMVHDFTKPVQLLFVLLLGRQKIGQFIFFRGKLRDLRSQCVEFGPDFVFTLLPFGDVSNEYRRRLNPGIAVIGAHSTAVPGPNSERRVSAAHERLRFTKSEHVLERANDFRRKFLSEKTEDGTANYAACRGTVLRIAGMEDRTVPLHDKYYVRLVISPPGTGNSARVLFAVVGNK
jgi:hypothetical protein